MHTGFNETSEQLKMEMDIELDQDEWKYISKN